jgi:hypothetical protein
MHTYDMLAQVNSKLLGHVDPLCKSYGWSLYSATKSKYKYSQ